MMKNIAWNIFKNTGNIDAFLEYKQISQLEKNLQKVEQNGTSENERYNNIGK